MTNLGRNVSRSSDMSTSVGTRGAWVTFARTDIHGIPGRFSYEDETKLLTPVDTYSASTLELILLFVSILLVVAALTVMGRWLFF